MTYIVLLEAGFAVQNFKQGPYMWNNDFFDRFKDQVGAALRLGSSLVAHLNLIQANLAKSASTIQDREINSNHERTRRVFCHAFLLNSDKKHFEFLNLDIVNELTHDRVTYPKL